MENKNDEKIGLSLLSMIAVFQLQIQLSRLQNQINKSTELIQHLGTKQLELLTK